MTRRVQIFPTLAPAVLTELRRLAACQGCGATRTSTTNGTRIKHLPHCPTPSERKS